MSVRYEHLISQSPRVFVVGDVMIDHTLWGKCSRISPEAPVPVVSIQSETEALGGAGNVARNLRALGAHVQVASVIGADLSGQRLRDLLHRESIGLDAVVQSNSRRTTCKTRIVAAHHQMLRFDTEDSEVLTCQEREAVWAEIKAILPSMDAVVLSDYAKGVLTPELTADIIAFATSQAIPVLVDPKGNDYTKYVGATLIKPNRKEAEIALRRTLDTDQALEEGICQLQESLKLRHAVITLSEDGLIYSDEQMCVHRIPALAREVFDVTGAGDTTIAALAFALAAGASIVEAAHLANSAAAVVVEKLGTATASWAEIRAFETTRSGTPETHILPPDQLLEQLAPLQSQGQQIAYLRCRRHTLDAPIIRLLEEQKASADVLVVILSPEPPSGSVTENVLMSDDAYMFAALACVDYVTYDASSLSCLFPQMTC